MAKYRILSLDGGGLRGLITARILQRLNDHSDTKNFLDKVDLIVGTSTGGILALGLAKGLSPEDICQLYIKRGGKIFDDSLLDNILDLGKVIGAEYSTTDLKRELKKVLGATTLGKLKRKVAITAFDLDNGAKQRKDRHWKPKIFHNFKGKGNDSKLSALNVALYTSAAPTYFPSVDGYIDGGVFANNPSMVAIAQAISEDNVATERAKLDDIVLLSVGTGYTPTYIKGQRLDWGLGQWAKPLVDVLMDGVSGIADYQSRQLLGDRYLRVQPELPDKPAIKLDSVKQIPLMDQLASDYSISKTSAWIKQNW